MALQFSRVLLPCVVAIHFGFGSPAGYRGGSCWSLPNRKSQKMIRLDTASNTVDDAALFLGNAAWQSAMGLYGATSEIMDSFSQAIFGPPR